MLSLRFHEKFTENAHHTEAGVKKALAKQPSTSAQVEYLKEQIKMRVYGCGWVE